MRQPGYVLGYDEGAVGVMRRRTAERVARPLLDRLEQGMSVLDCGCGVGSISVGLARAIRSI
jgi:2-polyprenyl-3-methyl-5-hydroxy-6-metoxy-1,4-benzoquinol methylase